MNPEKLKLQEKGSVLVLGAGASMHMGFPSGFQLVWDIIWSLESAMRGVNGDQYLQEIIEYQAESGITKSADQLVREYEEIGRQTLNALEVESVPKDSIATFLRHLRKSGTGSIDFFLEERLDDEVTLKIGKYAIAAILIDCESSKDISSRSAHKSWYGTFFNRLVKVWRTSSSIKETKIITFNYDRSLETYLATAYMGMFNADEEEAVDAISQLQISHVHGTLGSPWRRDNNFRKYENLLSHSSIKLAAEGIHLVSEDDYIQKHDQYLSAVEITKRHSNFHFLGFAYDERNIKKLNLCSVPDEELFGRTELRLSSEQLSKVSHGPTDFGQTYFTNDGQYLGNGLKISAKRFQGTTYGMSPTEIHESESILRGESKKEYGVLAEVNLTDSQYNIDDYFNIASSLRLH